MTYLMSTLHRVSKRSSHLIKVPTFKLSVTLCELLTDFQKFCTVGTRMKFATKSIQHYPTHLRHVATLPLEIKNANFLQIFSTYGRKYKQIAFSSLLPVLLIHIFRYLQCLRYRVFPILIANKIFHVTVLLLIYLRLICGTLNSSQQMSLQYSAMTTKFLIKSLYLIGCTTKRLTDEYSEKSWTKRGVNKLLKKLQDTGTVDR